MPICLRPYVQAPEAAKNISEKFRGGEGDTIWHETVQAGVNSLGDR